MLLRALIFRYAFSTRFVNWHFIPPVPISPERTVYPKLSRHGIDRDPMNTSTDNMDTSSTNSPPGRTVRSLLVEWANQQDLWIRELVSGVIVSAKACTAEHIEELYDTFLREKGLREGETVVMKKLGDEVTDLENAEPLILNRLEDLDGVNALAQAQCISFNPKVTIVFGENSSGKTGYVRVLKRAAAVRTAETVLPNLNAVSGSITAPSAKISFAIGNQTRDVNWKNESGLAPLNRIDVFDSRVSELHVDGDLTYVYTPGELIRFPLVQQGMDQVRGLLDRDIRAVSARTNPYAPQFDRACRFYPMIESLGAATDIVKLRAIAVVSDEEQSQIGTIRTEIDALRSSTPQAQMKLAESQRQHLGAILKVIDSLRVFDSVGYDQAVTEFGHAKQKYDEATSLAFAGSPIPGVLKKEWDQFIQAAEEYLRQTENPESYPQDDDVCVYCRQPLGAEAVALVQKYRDYCNGEFRSALNAAQERINGFIRNIRTADPATFRAHINELTSGSLNADRLAELRGVATKLEELRQACDSQRAYTWPDREQQMTRLQTAAQDADRHIGEMVADLKGRGEEREKALRQRESQLLDVESRMRLTVLLKEIESFVDQAKWGNQAQIQSRRFQGILRSLTETSKAASEQLLNRDFEKLFTAECAKLRAPKVRLLFPGSKGQVSRRKSLASDRLLSEVLSEGEQKVIALADFLAEIALKPAAPVVFDDPITSLDYRRMSEVIKRIVELSEQRQVIVFTHNIWFTTELLAEFEKRTQDCAYHDVTRDVNRIGIITKGNHPRSDTYKALRGKINDLLQTAERATGEAQAALIEKAYEYLRNICEVIVESELLQGVTQRYQANVRMTMLPNIKYDRLKSATSAIYPVYEDCCRFIGSHSQPIETLNVRPDLAQFKADWAKIEAARDAYVKSA